MFHHPDTINSTTYTDSLLLNNQYIQDLEDQYNETNRSASSLFVDKDQFNYKCVDNIVLEDKIRKNALLLFNNKCFVPPCKPNKTYSNALGYACNKEPNNFLYKLDEHNTYHNYPVCKKNDDNNDKSITCCPENIQLFNNWTRRRLPVNTSTNKPKKELIMLVDRIPSLKYNECQLY